jgi:hypothetical protein
MTWLPASIEKQDTTTQKVHSSVCKNEQNLPEGAVLLGVLKAIETELCKRELLGTAGSLATPLWFIAETERNVFLWRNGKSIGDHRSYSFWIDIRELINKRREQLGRSRGFNPFVNMLPSSGGSEFELRYLDALEEIADTIFLHAEALSRASERARQEILDEAPDERQLVILPCRGPSKATQ